MVNLLNYIFYHFASDALKILNQWAGQPLPLNASAWIGDSRGEGELSIRLAGAMAAVTSASQMMQEAQSVGEKTGAQFKISITNVSKIDEFLN